MAKLHILGHSETITTEEWVDLKKLDKLTDTGATNLLTAPEELGGQPGIVPMSSFATADTLQTVLGLAAGNTWQSKAAAENCFWYSVCLANNGRLVAVGLNPYDAPCVMVSDDNGNTWQAREAAENNIWVSVCRANNGRLAAVAYAVAAGTNYVMVSDDNGDTWQAKAAPYFGWNSMCLANNGRLVAVSRANLVMVSDDNGDTWQTKAVSNGEWFSVCLANNGRLVAVSYTGTNRVMVSDDNGDTWQTKAVPNGEWNSVCLANNGRLVAVAYDGANQVMVSDDNGDTWQTKAVPDGVWQSVCLANNGRLAAVASNGTNRVMVSDDNGNTWQARAAAENNMWQSVCLANNGRLVAVAYDGANQVMVSDYVANNFATAEQGAKADTALQSFTETDPTVPAWAKTLSKPTYTASEVGAASATHAHAVADVTNLQSSLDGLANRIDSLEVLGQYAGTFNTKALIPTNISGFANGITINDFVNVRADETQGGATTRYIATTINNSTGAITWTYDITFATDISGKQNTITSTGTTNLLTAPASSGGNPGTKAINTLLAAPAAQTANTQLMYAPATQGNAPTLVNKNEFLASPAAQTANTQLLVAPATKGNAPTLKPISDFAEATHTHSEFAAGSGPSNWYGTSSTAAGTTAKVVALQGTTTGFTRTQGTTVTVRFSTSNTVATPTLNVNSTGAAQIRYNGTAITGALLTAGDHTFQPVLVLLPV